MSGKQKGPGRPRIEFDERDVANIEKLAAVLNQQQLAGFLGCSERTLQDRIANDPEISAAYQRGRSNAIANVGTALLKDALAGNTTAQIFYLKTQARWSEKQEMELSGAVQTPGLTVVLKTDADSE